MRLCVSRLRLVTDYVTISNKVPSGSIYRRLLSTMESTTPKDDSQLPKQDITAAPAANQSIYDNGKEYTTVKEGLAYILIPSAAAVVPQNDPRGEKQAQSVFYNPIQQFNRDLSVLAIRAYGEEVMKRKETDAEKLEMKILNSRKNKKRKRGVNAMDNDSRKAGKLDDATADPEAIKQTNDKSSHNNFPELTNEAITRGPAKLDESSTIIEAAGQQRGKTDESDIFGGAMDNQAESKILLNGERKSKTHQPGFTILDALSATGLRALRYAKEIPFVSSVTANDLLATATEAIKLNVKHNKLESKIKSVTSNAMSHMYNISGEPSNLNRSSKKYDVIDLDPYGTAAMFLDSAVQAVRDDGGLLCVTCTDAGVWASNGYPEKCYSLYGGIPIKGMHCHEGGLRLILHAIATSAARYGLAIEPLLSLSIDFYARVFVKVRKSAAEVKFLAGKTMMVYNCDSGCGAWKTQLIARNKEAVNKNGDGIYYKHVFAMAPNTGELCEHCGTKTHLAGPMYAGPIHSPAFIGRILGYLPEASKDTYATKDRIEGMLSLALGEHLAPPADQTCDSPALEKAKAVAKATGVGDEDEYDPAAIDHFPFFIVPSVLSRVLHCITPHENALRGALIQLGYSVTRSHTKAGSIKTNAPFSVLWEIMREWVKQKAPVRDNAIKEGSTGWRIMGFDKDHKGSSLSDDNALLADGTKVDARDEAVSECDGKKGLEIIFDEEIGKEKGKKKLVRYQVNPRENWGPMNRASGHKKEKK